MPRISPILTTEEVLREVGERLRRYRLQQNLTLEEVARSAGVGLRTAVRAEAGDNPTLATVVKLLRALGRLEALDAFLPEPLVSPLDMARLAGQVRERASRPRRRSTGGREAPSGQPASGGERARDERSGRERSGGEHDG